MFSGGGVSRRGPYGHCSVIEAVSESLCRNSAAVSERGADTYTILYYTILYYTILYYTLLYSTIPCYAMLCHTIYNIL